LLTDDGKCRLRIWTALAHVLAKVGKVRVSFAHFKIATKPSGLSIPDSMVEAERKLFSDESLYED
jgi:hypothetical protein